MARKRGVQPIPWPSWRYGPEGQAEIFACEADVPEGWTRKPGEPEEPIDRPQVEHLDREKIIAQLLEKGIVADPRWAAVRLKDLL